jgi:sterol desaturase/sphingolipid hydroxylase (fatty acid hydroxylase superfamily)
MFVTLSVLGLGVVMMLCERAWPGRSWPSVAGWWTRAALLNGAQVLVVFAAGGAWDGVMIRHQPWSFRAGGTLGGAALGYLAITFVYYWWHRWRHEVPLLWRWLHQTHHSPQRIEVITSFYKHPLEILVNGLLSSAIVYLLVGLELGAGTAAVLLTGIAELFYHWNVRTPYWLGFLIQRPESHCIHHQEGVHRFNFSDLPLWDLLFGTFRNPREWSARCGLGAAAEQRLGAMLLGVDVSRPGSAAP